MAPELLHEIEAGLLVEIVWALLLFGAGAICQPAIRWARRKLTGRDPVELEDLRDLLRQILDTLHDRLPPR